MAEMFDAKQDKNKRKQELTLKEQKANRKRKIITITVIVVFLLAFATATLLNSNALRRNLSVITIDGVSFNTAQFEYFFNTEYQNLASSLEQQGYSFILPDTNRPLSSQTYDTVTGESWADYIMELTLTRMQDIVCVYNLALASGFELSEEKRNSIEESIASKEFEMLMYEIQYGYKFPSLDSYLQRLYGTSITSQIYREILEMCYLAEEYGLFMRDSLEYSNEQIKEYYEKNAENFDIYKYRAFVVESEEPDEATDYETALEESLSIARERAQGIADAVESEEDFITAALEYSESLYLEPESTLKEVQGAIVESVDYYYSSWLKDPDRSSGDVEVIDIPQGTAVLYFISREDNAYHTVGMRQLLILPDDIAATDFEDSEDDPGYLEALETAREEAYKRAQTALQLFEESGRTEEALIALMVDYSDDTTEGGFYEDISKYPYQGVDVYAMRVVAELEEWLFDPERAIGDSELIESEAYGYHLVYFMGYGRLFADLIAEDQMRTEDNNEWWQSIPRSEPVLHKAFILVTT